LSFSLGFEKILEEVVSLRKIFHYTIRFLLIFLFLSSLFLGARFLREVNGGFRLGKVLFDPNREAKPFSLDPEVEKLLKQPFDFLDLGCQTYVFVSRDGNYVLKLIRLERFQSPFWMDWVPLSKTLKRKFSFGRKKNLENAIKSYEMASSLLTKETQLLCVHLEPTIGLPSVRINNRFFQTIAVDLNRVGFLIQKRACPLKEYLLKKRKDLLSSRRAVASFIALTSSMLEKKIFNRDYNCIKNAGILGEELLFMDVGSFAFDERLPAFPAYEERMRNFLKRFYRFAASESPDLLPLLDQELSGHLQKRKEARG
jgi:hypothetical protein